MYKRQTTTIALETSKGDLPLALAPGFILIAVVLPLNPVGPTIIQFGFALSSGILLDAFLVRMVLMPAVLHALGDRCWWLPAWLDRLLARVDIEGASLEAGSAHPDPGVPGHEPAVPSAQPAESLH